ncbi:phycobilisome linker polypeptide [Pseudanabaena sp. Chao 1811]|uniref:phycobilisome linker polypeptide n=1 Tax=Pseudanabaena sp. Chao 1811 TaxID=2963092 RepID=UPI0022F39CF3|nr:phycobilisome linker polypeptide [Pseudanabaena sp. Chao 1811]
MKSVDIDSVTPSVDDYRNHQVQIEFTGGIQQGKVQGKTQIVTIAYSSLSKRMQTIRRLGGKIVNVSILRFQADDISRIDDEHVDANPAIATSIDNIHTIAESAASIEPSDKAIDQPAEVNTESTFLEESHTPIVEEIATEPSLAQNEHHSHDVENLESNADITSQDISEDIVVVVPEAIALVSEVTTEETLEMIAEPRVIPENILEEPVKTVDEPETISKNVAEPTVETVAKKGDIAGENIAAEILPIAAPKKSKSSLVAPKSKKTRTSAKHGFNKLDSKLKTHEPITNTPIAPIANIELEIAIPAPVVEPEIYTPVVESVPEIDVKITDPVIEASETVVEEAVVEEAVVEIHGATNVESIEEAVVETNPESVGESVETNLVEEAVVKTNLETVDESVEIHQPVVEPQNQHVDEVIPEPELQTSLADVVTPDPETVNAETPAIADEHTSIALPQTEVIATSAKSKKSKTASKSGHGFSKPKSRK